MDIPKPRIGLALGTGGSRGLAHVGVIKELVRSGIEISSIVGSSFGAVSGALFARDRDIEHMEYTMLQSPEWKDIMRTLIFLEMSYAGGITQGSKLETFINNEFGKTTFYGMAVPFSVIATKLKTGEHTVLTRGPVAKALLASMAFPSVFAPVKISGDLYIDGGLTEPVPARTVSKECDIVIAVNLDGDESTKFKGVADRPRDIMQQTISIYRYNLASYNTHHADIVVEPLIRTKSSAKWESYLSGDAVKSGERAMHALIPKLKEKIVHFMAKHSH